eukprot:363791-Chlamydomonas_euryale.AAC.5
MGSPAPPPVLPAPSMRVLLARRSLLGVLMISSSTAPLRCSCASADPEVVGLMPLPLLLPLVLPLLPPADSSPPPEDAAAPEDNALQRGIQRWRQSGARGGGGTAVAAAAATAGRTDPGARQAARAGDACGCIGVGIGWPAVVPLADAVAVLPPAPKSNLRSIAAAARCDGGRHRVTGTGGSPLRERAGRGCSHLSSPCPHSWRCKALESSLVWPGNV